MKNELNIVQTKTHVHVFLTKTFKFRAKITEPEQPSYEVTIGGVSWNNGKGRRYKEEIDKKAQALLFAIKRSYNNQFRK